MKSRKTRGEKKEIKTQKENRKNRSEKGNVFWGVKGGRLGYRGEKQKMEIVKMNQLFQNRLLNSSRPMINSTTMQEVHY